MHKSGSRKGQYRGVEQLVARRAHNPKVVGSSPASATKEKSHILFRQYVAFLMPQSTEVSDLSSFSVSIHDTLLKNRSIVPVLDKAYHTTPTI